MLRHLPNLITSLRMLLVVPLCWLIGNGHYAGALVVAAIAGLSDAVGIERTLSVVSASPPVDGVDATLALAP